MHHLIIDHEATKKLLSDLIQYIQVLRPVFGASNYQGGDVRVPANFFSTCLVCRHIPDGLRCKFEIEKVVTMQNVGR